MGANSQTAVKQELKTPAAISNHPRVTPVSANLQSTFGVPILYLQRTLGNQTVQKLLTSVQTKEGSIIQRQTLPEHRVNRIILGEGPVPGDRINGLAEQAKGLLADHPHTRIMIGYINNGSARYLGPNDPCPDDKRLSQVSSLLQSAGIPIERISIIYPPVNLDAPKNPMAVDLYDDISLSLDDYLRASTAPRQELQLPQVPPAPPDTSPSLSDMLKVKFKAGPVAIVIDIPKSLTATLPVAISSSKSLDFELKAETSGDFSFSMAFNGLAPHLTLKITAGVSVSKDNGTTGKAGIVIEYGTAYKADSPDKLKEDITKAGEKLTKAYYEAAALTTNEERLPKLIDAVGAIGEMYSAIDKAKSAAKPSPLFSFSFGAQGLLAPGDKTDPDPLKQPPTYIGPSFTLNF